MTVTTVDTPHGVARVQVTAPSGPARATLVLGHGAGGSVSAPDLQAVASAALAANLSVALVEQPYRVAGRRAPAPAHHLDAAWAAVIAHLDLHGHPLICGGRSSGARVACRTAASVGAAGILCLAFPLITPKGVSRQEELDAVSVPLLVVQGESDRFGQPQPAPGREVVSVRGDHGLKRDLDLVAAAALEWIERVVLAG